MSTAETSHEVHTYHFFVNKDKVTTTKHVLTGAEIKALVPGLDPNDQLELRVDGKKIPITDNQSVDIKDGLHFVTYPGGKDS